MFFRWTFKRIVRGRMILIEVKEPVDSEVLENLQPLSKAPYCTSGKSTASNMKNQHDVLLVFKADVWFKHQFSHCPELKDTRRDERFDMMMCVKGHNYYLNWSDAISVDSNKNDFTISCHMNVNPFHLWTSFCSIICVHVFRSYDHRFIYMKSHECLKKWHESFYLIGT